MKATISGHCDGKVEEPPTLVKTAYYNDEHCLNVIDWSINEWTHKVGTCVQLGNEDDGFRYEESHCVLNGLIEERVYSEAGCLGDPYDTFKLVHNTCRYLGDEWGLWEKQEIFGHCHGESKCSGDWICPEGWKVVFADNKKGARCAPDADATSCGDFG